MKFDAEKINLREVEEDLEEEIHYVLVEERNPAEVSEDTSSTVAVIDDSERNEIEEVELSEVDEDQEGLEFMEPEVQEESLIESEVSDEDLDSSIATPPPRRTGRTRFAAKRFTYKSIGGVPVLEPVDT